jgi:hypothetical protein
MGIEPYGISRIKFGLFGLLWLFGLFAVGYFIILLLGVRVV